MFEIFHLFSCRPRFFGLCVWENIPKKHDKKVTMDQLNRVCTEKRWKLKTVIKKKDDSEKWKWRQVRPVIDMSQKTWSTIQKMAVSNSGEEVHSCASGAFMSKTGRSKFREKPRKTKFLVEVGESLLKVEYARCRRAAEKRMLPSKNYRHELRKMSLERNFEAMCLVKMDLWWALKFGFSNFWTKKKFVRTKLQL